MSERQEAARERELIETMSWSARQLKNCELLKMFQNAVLHASLIATFVGPSGIDDIGEEAQLEFTVLRSELEARNLIRFH